MNVFVVIPSWNEAKNIGAVLQSLKKYDYQIVVVDDGSSDQTAQVASDFGVKVLQHEINRGQGAALYTGTLYALKQGADIIVHFDSDGQCLAEEISQEERGGYAGWPGKAIRHSPLQPAHPAGNW